MSTKRTRRTRRRAADLPDACFHHLADLLDPGVPWPDEVIGMIYFDDPMSIEEAWAKHRDEAIAAHQAVHGPYSYPELWWHHDAPGNDGGDDGGGGGGLHHAA
jgi:hypothetical protein